MYKNMGPILCYISVVLFVIVNSLKYEAPDWCTWNVDSNETGRVTVSCKLRTLQNDAPLTSLQTDGTSRLRLECSEALVFESSLAPAAFQRLTQLEDLEVEFCKLAQLPQGVFKGLRDLKRLSVRTHNSVWSSKRQLEISSASFDGLRELQTLDLAQNNMRDLPGNAFCSLVNLNVLNLSDNALEKLDAGLLGEESRCGADVLILDVSHNNLSELPTVLTSPRRRRLQQLHIHDNQLTALRASSLAGLGSLRILNASSNMLVDLPAVPLRETCRELREVHLRSNSLHNLGDTFSRLEQLLVLDVAKNQLIDLSTSLAGLIRLIVLDLAGNALTRLEPQAFKDLYSLQILDLRDNAIVSVADDAFLPLYNLHTLNLAGNRLKTVGPSMLNGLFVLNKLTLSLNLLTDIDPRAFRNCSDLKELDLSGNVLTEVPIGITELPFLRTLDLGENRITGFRNGSFRNLQQLTGLRLIDNSIGNVTADMLWDLTGLQVLNMAKNKVQHVERGSFDRNERLEAIRLDANYLTDVNGVFTVLPELLWLNLSDNHLVWFDFAFIPPSLQWLDIHLNFVEKLGNYYEIVDGFHLKTVDASQNRLTELSALSLPNSVEIFLANNNQITRVAPATFTEKKNLTRADLYGNELEYLDLMALRIARIPPDEDENSDIGGPSKPLPEFFLGGNPFRCDCSMEWLQRVNNMTNGHGQYPRVMDLDDVVCRITHSRGNDANYTMQPVLTAPPSSFLCKYESHCFALCHCCDFDACDCEMMCPQNCSCYHDQSWSANLVDCSGAGHITIPSRIPMDATELYLDGNSMRELRNHAFIGRKNMRVLYVNDSGVETIQNRTFNGLHSLEALHLQDNKLRVLRGFEFDQLGQLIELYLQNNRLSHIHNTTFLPLRSLKLLRLDGNRLASFPVWQLPVHNPQLTELALSGNPWSCRCRFSSELRSWLANTPKTLESGRMIIDDGASQCLTAPAPAPCISEDEQHAPVLPLLLTSDYLPTIIVTLLVILVVIIVAVLAFAYRENVRLWIFSKYGVRMFNKTSTAAAGAALAKREDKDKLYDVYVCYSRKDEEQIIAGLASGLEAGGYGVCLHHRDLPCSDAAIIEAAEASRRVILVVTRGFLQTEWPRREFRGALHEALHGRTFKLVIVEENGGIPPELERDPDLRPYLKTARRIRWGDKKFWERLRYSMPEIRARENQYRQNISHSMDSRGRPSFPSKRGKPPAAPEPLNNMFQPENNPQEHIYSSIEPDYAGTWEDETAWAPPPSTVREHHGQAYLV